LRYSSQDGFMLCAAKLDQRLEPLEEQLRTAEAITGELMSAVIASACPHFRALPAAAKAKVNWLIQAGAWTDATLALVQLELPQWEVQRLSHNRGDWTCSLSKQPKAQGKHRELAAASHRVLPLAILRALLREKRAGV
jgi:hypothetical protein